MTQLIAQRGKPGMIVSHNGTELSSNAVLACPNGRSSATRLPLIRQHPVPEGVR